MNRHPLIRPGRSAAAVLVGTVVVGVPSAALAGFGAGASNPGNELQAVELVAPSTPTAGPSPTSPSSAIDVSWVSPSGQAPVPVAYQVLDTTTGRTVCTNMTDRGSCTETGLLPGTTYHYTVEAYLPGHTGWTSDPAVISSTTADLLAVVTPGEVTAGTAFTTTLTAQKATSAADPTLVTDTSFSAGPATFAGPAAMGGHPPSYGSVPLTSGVATVSTTLYAAGPSSITATAGPLTGTSKGFTVDSAGGRMGFAGNPTVSTTSPGSFSITMPSDQYGNAFVSASGVPVTVTLTPTGHPVKSWSLNGRAGTDVQSTLNLTIKTGPTGNTFTVQPGSKNISATLSATTTAPGFTAPPQETLTGS